MKRNKITESTFVDQVDLQSMSVMGLLQLGSGALLKEAISQEITEYLGRSWYQRSVDTNVGLGHRNGFQRTRMETPIGGIEYDRPKVAYAPDFRSQFHTPHMRKPEEFAAAIADMYVNGVSTRKVKDSLKAVTGKKVSLGKSTVSRITKKMKTEFREWQKRDLSQIELSYLFIDAIRIGMRMGGKDKDAVLLAYGVSKTGDWVMLSIDIAQSESNSSWGRFLEDLKMRGLKDPLLAISDGNQGAINAIDIHFPTSYRQRCLKHRMDNILDAVPPEGQEKVEEELKKIFYGATSLEQAKSFVKRFRKSFSKAYPTAVKRLDEDLDQCLTYYLFPSNHWRRIRTGNKLERLNKEIRRRLKVIGRHPDEDGCLALIYQVTTKYADKQNKCRLDDLTEELWQRLRQEKVAMQTQLTLDLYIKSA